MIHALRALSAGKARGRPKIFPLTVFAIKTLRVLIAPPAPIARAAAKRLPLTQFAPVKKFGRPSQGGCMAAGRAICARRRRDETVQR